MRELHRSWICLVALLVAMPATAQRLVNSGFEDNLNNWNTFGQGWRTGGGGAARSGSLGAVNQVKTSNADTYRGLFQNVPVISNNLYKGGAYIRAVNVDNSASWFELQFLDSRGSVIVQYQSTHVATAQGFTFMGIGPVLAPAGAVTASVRAIVYMPSAVGGTDYHIFDDVEFTNVTPVHSISQKRGFETGDIADWSTLGQEWSIGTGADTYSHAVLRSAGVRVPEDVALAGFDDTDLARHLNLTTVHVPMKLIGHAATQRALDLMEDRDSVHPQSVPTRLVARNSCGAHRMSARR
ncbi:MAG: substrate-binding domain-containing protein [Kiritimatiellae bacterium]|nr:substrate-binding domain-containing protein [Kiritimatiellia bacterium]